MEVASQIDVRAAAGKTAYRHLSPPNETSWIVTLRHIKWMMSNYYFHHV